MLKNYPDWTKAINKEGYVFIMTFSVITFLIGSANSGLGSVCFAATIWCVYFFRDPVRIVPQSTELVTSPADGIVQSISIVSPPLELGIKDEEMTRVSIFLNLLNVHVNRVPVAGKIKKLHYNPGKFFNASLDKASIHNERQLIVMETETKHEIAFVQIAGLISRRIVCDLEEGMNVSLGDRFGIIRFGSRLDVYLPKNIDILISPGQTAVAGETIIANLKNTKLPKHTFTPK
ncbi:MAG: phosphatidylserine decarboxylase [Rickettsiaceae bacterium]|nr:phosphatidylserine decarboxylase [Rickettsiaceae bacterium]